MRPVGSGMVGTSTAGVASWTIWPGRVGTSEVIEGTSCGPGTAGAGTSSITSGPDFRGPRAPAGLRSPRVQRFRVDRRRRWPVLVGLGLSLRLVTGPARVTVAPWMAVAGWRVWVPVPASPRGWFGPWAADPAHNNQPRRPHRHRQRRHRLSRRSTRTLRNRPPRLPGNHRVTDTTEQTDESDTRRLTRNQLADGAKAGARVLEANSRKDPEPWQTRTDNTGRHPTAIPTVTKNPIPQTDDGGHQYAHPGLLPSQTGHWKANG